MEFSVHCGIDLTLHLTHFDSLRSSPQLRAFLKQEEKDIRDLAVNHILKSEIIEHIQVPP